MVERASLGGSKQFLQNAIAVYLYFHGKIPRRISMQVLTAGYQQLIHSHGKPIQR
jgi:hypothetical protein